LTVQKTVEQISIIRDTVRLILTKELNMKKACTKMVPKNLSGYRTIRRKEIFSDLPVICLKNLTFWEKE